MSDFQKLETATQHIYELCTNLLKQRKIYKNKQKKLTFNPVKIISYAQPRLPFQYQKVKFDKQRCKYIFVDVLSLLKNICNAFLNIWLRKKNLQLF